MLFITTSHPLLVSQHIYQEENKTPQAYRNVDLLELSNLLLKGSIIKPAFQIIQLKTDKPPKEIKQSPFNTTYLCIESLKHWKPLIEEKEWINEIRISPERYKKALNKSQLLNDEAKDWFWRKFKYSPKKVEMELYNLSVRFSQFENKIPLGILEGFYNSNSIDLFIQFTNNFGTPLGTKILTKLTSGDIWSLLIGSKSRPAYIIPSLLDHNKEEKCPELYVPLTLYQSSVLDGLIDVKVGAILLNQWLIEIGLKRIKGRLKVNYSIDELKKLENYLGRN